MFRGLGGRRQVPRSDWKPATRMVMRRSASAPTPEPDRIKVATPERVASAPVAQIAANLASAPEDCELDPEIVARILKLKKGVEERMAAAAMECPEITKALELLMTDDKEDETDEGEASPAQIGLPETRVAVTGESQVEYIASNAWAGPRPGYAFYRGPQGLGYYVDPHQTAEANGFHDESGVADTGEEPRATETTSGLSWEGQPPVTPPPPEARDSGKKIVSDGPGPDQKIDIGATGSNVSGKGEAAGPSEETHDDWESNFAGTGADGAVALEGGGIDWDTGLADADADSPRTPKGAQNGDKVDWGDGLNEFKISGMVDSESKASGGGAAALGGDIDWGAGNSLEFGAVETESKAADGEDASKATASDGGAAALGGDINWGAGNSLEFGAVETESKAADGEDAPKATASGGGAAALGGDIDWGAGNSLEFGAVETESKAADGEGASKTTASDGGAAALGGDIDWGTGNSLEFGAVETESKAADGEGASKTTASGGGAAALGGDIDWGAGNSLDFGGNSAAAQGGSLDLFDGGAQLGTFDVGTSEASSSMPGLDSFTL